ncbi:cache domain-containing sensor histidine kinase [Paenibacillus tarimensis]|uniref:cache domain-containing sensor histidine kinase n=1 Tax=Paenibacillus tarimensis TaxID=416012 RepID=UPI001F2C489C|nr:sensor histidine kinase [Paenibacillus tarimensis]MCF2944314.1 sensor histidine kinase [Paenibacillus tarimensis]
MTRGMHSIHNRVFLLFLSCMLALLLLVSFLYDRYTTAIIHTKISEMAEKNIAQTVGLFDLLLEGYDSVTKSLNSNYELLRLLQERDREADPALSVINERTITNILGAVYYSRDDIVAIHVITNDRRMYSYEKRFAGVIDMDYASSEWYKKLSRSTGEMIWLGLFQGSVMNSLQQEPVFVFGRQLYDLTDQRPIGLIFIETNPAPILSALSNVTISPNSRVFIMDDNNRVIASTDEEAMPYKNGNEAAAVNLPAFSGLPRPEGGRTIVDNRTEQLIVAADAAIADWTVYGFTPKADIAAEVVESRRYLLLVVLALVILATVLASVISRNLSSPLKLLIREMKQVEMGNFRGSVNVKSYDEINSLVSSFNRMVHRIDELIERMTLSSISEKNAQLQALQSQVNPHFLYNTLDMIYWMLDERENDRLGRVILALSHMFRYSSDWEEASKTTLGQELEQMRHYMTIIESRLEGRVTTAVEVDDKWRCAVLPKMSLQPIIENAVKYGLEPLGKAGVLCVRAKASGNELQIIIEDNGVGMEGETLEALAASLNDGDGQQGQAKRRGIGLSNVHRRIALMYGNAYGLQLCSKPGEGTRVTIVLPIQQRGGNEHGYSYRG